MARLTEQFTGGSGPHGLSLTRRGEVLALLRKPHELELLVFKLGRRGRLLGAVALGHHTKGRSLIIRVQSSTCSVSEASSNRC